MITVRNMKSEDFPIVERWWKEWGETPCPENFYPPTSYVAEHNGHPMASACLYLMNCREAAMIENVVGNPTKHIERRESMPHLFRHMEDVARGWGYNRLVILAFEEKVKCRYQELGFSVTKRNVTSFAKLLRGGN